ncbi:hypothetical protein M3Y99_00634800 [Aphelenchoides fujianensis]|nr:hypothetical protein M3Y99_00634800 [Aphelenchoides fujianensis]
MAFEGKVVIITGSSSGLGQDAAVLFGSKGAKVTIHGQHPGRIEGTLELLKSSGIPEANVHVVRGPLEEEAVVRALIDETIEKFGRIDILINNAGCYEKAGAEEPESMDTFDFVMAVNLRSPVMLTKLAVPHLEKTKGCVVNVSSMLSIVPIYIGAYYSTSKAALDHYTKAAALRLAPKGVRVNSVAAGHIDTPFLGPNRTTAPLDFLEMYKGDLDARTPLGRRAQPAEINAVVEFLCSPGASFITGSVIVADGGYLSGVLPPKQLQA